MQMNKATKLLAFLGLMASSVVPAHAVERGDFRELYQGQSVDDLVISYMEENHVPGLSLAIVQAPYIPRVIGYGLADTNTRRLVATNTVFNIGQMTNAFTAVAVMQLVESEKMKLDEPISQYVSNLPKAWQKITIRDLMTHSSGLPNYTEAKDFNYQHNYTPEQIIKLVADKPLVFETGTDVANSATDFYLLGMAIEKASGMSYQDYVKQNQFDRLHLRQTFFPSGYQAVKNEVNNGSKPFVHSQFKNDPVYINPIEAAVGYTQDGDKLMEVAPINESAAYADASILAAAQDISFWDIGLAGDILVKDPKNREFLYQAITLKNGKKIPANVGWQFPGRPGLMFIEGHLPGFSAFLSRFTKELVCVTLLANKDNLTDLELLGRKIAGAYDGKLAAPVAAAWVESRESPYSITETLDRLSALVQQQGGKVFARIDHTANAKEAGQELNPMQVLVLGNPAKGTALLDAQNTMALDLPMRAMAWQDKAGSVWLSFTNPIVLGKAYGVQGQDKLLKEMYDGLSGAVKKATSAY